MKNKQLKTYINYYTFVYQNYLVFVQPDLKNADMVVIRFKYALRDLESQTDRSDPRILNLIAKDKNGAYTDLSLSFDDVNKLVSAKKSLEENRKTSRNMELMLMNSYFEALLNDFDG